MNCAGFSRWLSQERELRGLSREQVAAATKIAPATLDAIESGDAARMPAKAYLVGYLRAYAGAVGLDADDVVLRWQEVAGAEGEAPRPGRAGRVTLLAALGIAALLGLLAALYLAYENRPAPAPARPRPMERGSYPTSPR